MDPIPTNLLKECSDGLISVISSIVNQSLSCGTFPEIFKHAIVTPLLKKQDLELEFKNYRPVSNLSFLSKITERIVAAQLHQHMEINHLNVSCQSAYRKHHSD